MNLVVGNCSWNQLLLVSTNRGNKTESNKTTNYRTDTPVSEGGSEAQDFPSVFDLRPLRTKRPITPCLSCVSAPLGPPDRRPRDVQRHPEGLGRLPAAGGPGLTAAPAALAVVLQPLLLTGRLVASQAAAMDLTKSICTKKEKKRNEKIISFFSVKAVVLFLPPPPDLFLTFVLLLFFLLF